MADNFFKINKGVTLAPQASEPAGQNGDVYYNSTLNRFRQYQNGSWKDLGSGSGSGSKNYLSTYLNNPGNGDFENNSTAGWGLGIIGTLTNGLPTGTPTFGSGASGNLSIATVGSGQLAGSYSLSYASSAATTQGNMLHSDVFAIDSEDQAKILTWKFYYKAQTNPANANWSGTSSNSFGVAIWDVTNSAWISTTASFGMTQSSGVGIASGTFQTSSTTASLRFVVYNVNATSGAVTLYFDDFFLGPQTAPLGFAGTDGQAYIPTFSAGFGSVTNIAVKQYRRGDKLRTEGTVTAGTTTNAIYSITLPSGLSIDTAKISIGNTTANPGQNVGFWVTNGATGGNGSVVTATGTDATKVYFAGGTGGNATGAPFTGTGLLTNSGTFSFWFEVPIAGWSSNVQMSNDTDTRVVAFTANKNGNQIIGATNTKITNLTTVKDTHGGWDIANNKYVIPVSGFYDVTMEFVVTGTPTGLVPAVRINGSTDYFIGMAATANRAGGSITLPPYLNAGDTVEFIYYGTADTLVATTGGTYFCLKRLSGPAVIAATESVNASYTTTAGQTVNNTTPIVIFGTKGFDTHNAYNSSTGVFTTPVSGKYLVSAYLTTTGVVLSTTQSIQPNIFVNGSVFRRTATIGNGASNSYRAGVADIISLNAGDTLDIRCFVDISTTLSTQANNVFLSISRVGN